MSSLPRLFFAATALLFAWSGPVHAQDEGPHEVVDAADVALFASGTSGGAVSEAFGGLVPLPAERRVVGYDAERLSLAENDDALGYVVTIDTDRDLVQVLRRVDGARFERRFEASEEDSYAVALVAAELLEVARSGGDPVELGLVATASATTDLADATPTEPTDETAEPATQNAATGVDEEPLGDTAAESGPRPWTLTVGVHAELWVSPSDESPWLVQPGLFLDVLARVGPLLLGGGAFASGFGAYDAASADAEATYHRYDFGARITAGFDVRASATRLLLHVRGGGSVVAADGRTISLVMQQTRSESTGAVFVGLGLEARQPVALGLEVYLDLSVEALPSPVAFVAFDETLVGEGPLRLAARLGAAWRIE